MEALYINKVFVRLMIEHFNQDKTGKLDLIGEAELGSPYRLYK